MATRVSEAAEQRLDRPERHSLADLAYETIVEGIIDGTLQPGSRLSVDELVRQLDMSNTPIREALSRTVAERLVVQVTNKGYTIAPMLSGEAYHQLFDMRHLLEIHAMTFAAFDQANIDDLAELVDAMPGLTHGPRYRDFKDFNRADREFHHTLVRMSQNMFLIKAWEDLYFHLHVGRLYTGAGIIDYSHALREHSGIVQALQAGERKAAITCVSQHIKNAENRLKSLLQEKESNTL